MVRNFSNPADTSLFLHGPASSVRWSSNKADNALFSRHAARSLRFPLNQGPAEPSLRASAPPTSTRRRRRRRQSAAPRAACALLRHHLSRAAELLGEILQLRQPVAHAQHRLLIVDVHARGEL